jgi:polyisoprenoid-binding protein YceI
LEHTVAAGRPLAGTWEVDQPHSSVGFVVHHLAGLAAVRGSFADYDAVVEVAEDLAASRLEATVRVASLSTRNESRDEALLGEGVLAAAAHPEIRFRSTHVALDRVEGELTVRGTTVPLELTGTITPGVDARGYERLYFDLRGRLDTAGFIPGRSDDLELVLEISAWREAA